MNTSMRPKRSAKTGVIASTRAYEIIRNAIMDGRFATGTRLKEEELTVFCGASRTPVREALKRLAFEELVVITPHAGAQVAGISGDDLQEIYALRTFVEAHAAARAAHRLDADGLVALEVVQAKLEATVRDGGRDVDPAFLPLNAAFHGLILEAAASVRLTTMARLVVELPFAHRTLMQYGAEDLQRALGHHRELMAAFRARDADWAASVMASHIRAALQVLLRG